MGKTSEEGRGGEGIRMWGGEIVREPGESEVRGTADSPRPVREARVVETLVSDASYQAVGGYCLETGWRYGLTEEERRWTVRGMARRDPESSWLQVPLQQREGRDGTDSDSIRVGTRSRQKPSRS